MSTNANSVRSRPARKGASAVSADAAMVEITPPLDVGFLMSSVQERWESFRSVRTPLYARALVLECARERVALVSLDLLGLHSKSVGGWPQFKRAISNAATGLVAADRTVIMCTHTHSAPESSAVTGLYRTEAFQKWESQLIERIGQAIRNAVAN